MTRHAIATVLGATVVAAAAGAALARAQAPAGAPSPAMAPAASPMSAPMGAPAGGRRWEYNVKHACREAAEAVGTYHGRIESLMNREGGGGWEAVAVTAVNDLAGGGTPCVMVTYKREKPAR